jgi:uncharacterized membrane protein
MSHRLWEINERSLFDRPIDPWQVFINGRWVLFFGVSLPAVAITSLFVGLLAKSYSRTARLVAILPMCVVASGFQWEAAWISLVFVLIGVFLASLSERPSSSVRNTLAT